MRESLKTDKLATMEDLEQLVRDVYEYGRAPISQVKLSGFDEAIKATLAWIGLTRGRDTQLLRILIGRFPLAQAQQGKAGAIYAKRVAEDSYAFTDSDGFDQLKSTLYYLLSHRMRKLPT